MSCTKTNEVLGCHTDADGNRVSVIIHNISDSNGAVFATYYLDQEHKPIPGATAANVTVGACPVAQPDVDWVQYCDELEDGSIVPFMCQVITSFDSSGAAIVPSVTAFYEMDKVTPYTVQGEATICDGCPAIADVGVLNDWASLEKVVP